MTEKNVMSAEIDLMKNATYVVKDGKIEIVPIPPSGYGQQIINWQGGKPSHGKLIEDFKF